MQVQLAAAVIMHSEHAREGALARAQVRARVRNARGEVDDWTRVARWNFGKNVWTAGNDCAAVEAKSRV